MKVPLRILALAFFLCSLSVSGQVLRSAAEPAYPPFSIVNPDGTAGGMAVELLNEVADVMGLTVEFKVAPWAQIKDELANGELDVLPLVGRTPEREALYDFTIPYLTLHGAIFVRQDEAQIHDSSDLAGKRIAVMAGDNAEEYVRRAALSDQIIATPTFEEAFRMLADGQADAVIAQKLMGVTLLKKTGLLGINVVGKPSDEFKQTFSFAVKKGNSELLAQLNEGLAIIVAKGTHRRLMDKWLGMSETFTARSRVLLYGDDPGYPPYMFLDKQGRPSGFHVELLRAIAAKTGLKIAVQPDPWSEVIQKMENGELDITSMLYTPERDRLVDFSLPHSVMYASVFTRTGAPPYTADLKGRRIAVQEGDMLHEYALAQGWGDTLTRTASEEEALALLADGKVDFVLGYHIPGTYWIQKNGWKNIRDAEPHLIKTKYCFVVQEGNHELLSLLDDGLRQLKETGEYKTIYDKWLGGLDDTRRPIPLWFWIAAYGIGSTVIILFGANWVLRHQVHKKTAELRKSEERFEIAATAGRIGVWDRDIVHNQLVWDDRMFELYRVNPTEFGGTYEAWAACIHPDDRADAEQAIKRAKLGEKDYNAEFRIIRPDGEIRHIHAFGKVIRAKDGSPLRMIGTNQDVTERWEAEQQLLESEKNFRAMIETLPFAIFQSTGLEQRCIYLNSTFHQFFGYTIKDNPFVSDWFIRAYPDATYRKQIEAEWTEKVQTALQTHLPIEPIETVVTCKDRTKKNILWGYIALENINYAYGMDLTERKQAEESLKARNEELGKFNKAAVGRELRMIELKKEVNALCRKSGAPEIYP